MAQVKFWDKTFKTFNGLFLGTWLVPLVSFPETQGDICFCPQIELIKISFLIDFWISSTSGKKIIPKKGGASGISLKKRIFKTWHKSGLKKKSLKPFKVFFWRLDWFHQFPSWETVTFVCVLKWHSSKFQFSSVIGSRVYFRFSRFWN